MKLLRKTSIFLEPYPSPEDMKNRLRKPSEIMEQTYSCRFWLESIEQKKDFFPAKFVRGQGRGGQKRNKTSNAAEVRFHHLRAEASASRSKEKNWRDALHKLKIAIASDCTPHYSERYLPPEVLQQRMASFRVCAESHPDFPKSLGCLIDLAINLDFDWEKLAASLRLSKSGLTKWFLDHPEIKKLLLDLAYQDKPQPAGPAGEPVEK